MPCMRTVNVKGHSSAFMKKAVYYLHMLSQFPLKDTVSTVAKRGSVFIGLMTPDGVIWFRYQRAVLMR